MKNLLGKRFFIVTNNGPTCILQPDQFSQRGYKYASLLIFLPINMGEKLLVTTAKKMTRTELDRELKKTRKDLASAKSEYEKAKQELEKYKARTEDFLNRLNEKRKAILDLTKHTRNMDLIDAQEMYEDKQNGVSYIRDGKKYHVEVNKDTNEVDVIPMKEWKKNKNDINCAIDEGIVLDIVNDEFKSAVASLKIIAAGK